MQKTSIVGIKKTVAQKKICRNTQNNYSIITSHIWFISETTQLRVLCITFFVCFLLSIHAIFASSFLLIFANLTTKFAWYSLYFFSTFLLFMSFLCVQHCACCLLWCWIPWFPYFMTAKILLSMPIATNNFFVLCHILFFFIHSFVNFIYSSVITFYHTSNLTALDLAPRQTIGKMQSAAMIALGTMRDDKSDYTEYVLNTLRVCTSNEMG